MDFMKSEKLDISKYLNDILYLNIGLKINCKVLLNTMDKRFVISMVTIWVILILMESDIGTKETNLLMMYKIIVLIEKLGYSLRY